MRTLAIMLFPAVVLTVVQACSGKITEHRATIEWTPLPAAEVRALCGQTYADGCVKQFGTVCRIISEPAPLQELTGYNHDLVSPIWRTLGSELLHCFGYEHQPTPK